VWAGDVEEGHLGDWDGDGGGGEFNSGNADSTASTDVAHSGSYAVRMTQSNGGTRMFRWNEGRAHDQAYYSAWFYFPQRYDAPNWWNIFQFKSRNADGSRNDPFWLLDVLNRSDGAMYLRLYNWVNSRGYTQTVANLPVGQWVKIEAYLDRSTSDDGRIVILQDGVTLYDVSGITTEYAGGPGAEWSVNNYSDNTSPVPTVIYTDDYRIETGG
jgi:hypothetical protein